MELATRVLPERHATYRCWKPEQEPPVPVPLAARHVCQEPFSQPNERQSVLGAEQLRVDAGWGTPAHEDSGSWAP